MKRALWILAIVVVVANAWVFLGGRGRMGEHALRGVVVDESGKPIDGAMVSAARGVSDYEPFDVEALAVTASGGKFELALDPGPWYLGATASGQVAVLSGASTDSDLEVVVRPAAYVVHGVVSANGKPVPHAAVRAVRFEGRSEAVIATVANRDGEYALSLPPLEHLVEASAPGFRRWSNHIASGEIPLNFHLQPGARVSGRILEGKTGRPVAFAQVQARDVTDVRRSSLSSPTVSADRDGRFEFTTLDPSEYRFVARGRNLLGYSAESAIATISDSVEDLVIECWPARTAAGRVRDRRGKPVAGAEISVWRENADTDHPRTWTAADGTFFLGGLAPWSSRLTVHADGFRSHSVNLELVAGNVDRIEIELYRGASVSGVVFDKAGQPAAGALVGIGDPAHGGLFASVVTESDGRFELEGLSSGNVRVVARHLNGFAESHPMTLECDSCGERATHAKLELRLGDGVSINGTVRGDDGEPVAGAAVFAEQPSADRYQVRYRHLATADALGRYEFRHIAGGEWFVGASRTAGVPIGIGSGLQALAKKVIPTMNGTVVDLTLPSFPHTLEGHIADDIGPVGNAAVRVFNERVYRGEGRAVETDRDGRFRIEGIEAGRFELTVVAPGRTSFDSRSEPEAVNVTIPSLSVALKMKARSRVAGIVVNEKGVPEGDFFIEEGFLSVGTTVHGTSGGFVLTGLSAWDRHDITVKTPSGKVGVLDRRVRAAGNAQSDVRIEVAAGIVVKGRIEDALRGGPIVADVDISGIGPGARGRSRPDGSFSLRNVPAEQPLHLSIFPAEGGSADQYPFKTPRSGEIDLGTLRPIHRPDVDVLRTLEAVDLVATWSSSGGAAIVRGVPKDAPAALAGIEVGDRIIAVDGRTTDGVGNWGIVQLLSGAPGTSAQLVLESADGTKKTVSVKRTRPPY